MYLVSCTIVHVYPIIHICKSLQVERERESLIHSARAVCKVYGIPSSSSQWVAGLACEHCQWTRVKTPAEAIRVSAVCTLQISQLHVL